MIKNISEANEFRVPIDDGKLMVNTNGGIWPLEPSLIGLKYLVFSGYYFNQVMGDISSELVWLRWFQIGQPNLPSGLPLSKLRVLELYEIGQLNFPSGLPLSKLRVLDEEHHLEELWGETEGEAPVQLRQLLISDCCKFQGFPKSIGHLKHLKKIIIIGCPRVTSLPDEFCLLHSLENLEFYECENLSSLPSNFGNLSNLRHLSLHSNLRRLPVTFKNLKLLEHLNLADCYELTFTSEDLNFLENTTKLEYLDLSGCDHLEEFPRHITNQASLRELNFSYTRLRELPDNIGQLSRLTEMQISYMFMLTSLPASLGDLSSLTNLVIDFCPKLERAGMESLPKSIRQLKNLQRLSISYCSISELDFGLSNLKKISLSNTELCRISFSEDCPYLERLDLSYNHHLKEIEALPRTLNYINLKNCEMLKNIPSFAGLASLEEFHLEGCYGIEKIEDLENCTRLERLSVNTCWEVPGIESLEQMQNLKRLQLIANKGSVIGRCIQKIQKWPDEEIIICARAVPDAASLVHSLLSPNLIILDSISNRNINSISNRNINSWPPLVLKSPSGGDAIMFCCVINCVSSQMELKIADGLWKKHNVEVEKGRWAWVGVFATHSYAKDFIIFTDDSRDCAEVEKGFLARGAEQTTVEAVRSLLPLFLQS